MDPPAATIGNPADLLHISMRQVTRPAGGDRALCAVGFPARVEEPSPAQPEPSQVPRHGPPVEPDAKFDQLGSDPGRRPLLVPTPGLDLGDHLWWGCVRAVTGHRGPVDQAKVTVTTPPVHPLRRARPPDPHLGSHMSDPAVLTTLHEPTTAFNRQRALR